MENCNTMKKLKKIGYPALVLLLTSLSFASCSDAWDAHYSLENTGKIDSNLFDYIRSRNDLSIFKEMIVKTGYDSILNQSKAYTVWAPTNASLEGSPILLDTASWKNLVGNHIASNSHSISQADSLTITMLNGKRLLFDYKNSAATMDNVTLIEKDIATQNGLVQVISTPLTYRYNQWENILLTPGLDSLRSFVKLMDFKMLDVERSYDNNVFIDSVFINTNLILKTLGSFDKEDSIYTSILPDNAAWIDAYNRIFPYFKTKTTDGGALVQHLNTQWSIIRDLFFWGRIDTPVTDSVKFSTSWNKLTNPDSLFMNAEKMILSNGFAYKTSKLHHKSIDSWCKEIRVEAERANDKNTRLKENFSLLPYSSLGTNFNVSNANYLYCKSLSTSDLSPLSVTFPIPNTLSTKYNIYVVFVPTVITDTTDKRPCKLEFYLTYNVNLASVSLGPLPTYSAKLAVTNNITDPLNMTKMLIAKDFEFTTTNLSGGGDLFQATTPQGLTSPINIGLKIKNIAKNAEKKTFNRDMRIDCIILEPVQ